MKSSITLILSIIAILMSAFACYSISSFTSRHKAFSAYDFSTPAAALRSESQMLADGNIPALIQNEIRQKTPKAHEKLQTLEIKKEAEWKGTKLLFTSFEVGGIRKYDVTGFEKDANSGLWFQTYFSTYSLPDDANFLKQSIIAWEKDGTLNK